MALAGSLFRWKQGDPDRVTAVDQFARKLPKENGNSVLVMHYSLPEANT